MNKYFIILNNKIYDFTKKIKKKYQYKNEYFFYDKSHTDLIDSCISLFILS